LSATLFRPAQPVDEETFGLHVVAVDGEVFADERDCGQFARRSAASTLAIVKRW
jgi:hypothetical protein